MKFVAIFNSRQSKIILGQDRWVKQSLKAVEIAISQNFAVITSVDMPTYELLVWAVQKFGGKQLVIIPDNVDSQLVIEEFKLDPQKTLFQTIPNPSISKRKSWWFQRDELIAEKADVIYPISIRPGGNLDRILRKHQPKIVSTFRISYNKVQRSIEPPPSPDEINKKFLTKNWHFLTHWTSTSYRPWCNEKLYEFYECIVNSDDDYAHSAFNGLKNILKIGRICASSSKVRGEVPVVSFTELSPLESLKLMRWSHRKVGFYWEPYGIAIDKSFAIELGVRPVIYGDEKTFKQLNPHLKPYFQPKFGRKYRWEDEREWRYTGGDFDLTVVPKNKFLIITRTKAESTLIKELFDVRVFFIT